MSSSEASASALPGVAIVGMAGRFPGCADIEAFWSALRAGTELISVFSDEQLRSMGVEPALLDNPSYVKARGVLEDAALFDAAFFGFSPREAAILDPQHRVFLETAWTALEHAGYSSAFPGSIGVYAGTGWTSYLLFNLAGHARLLEPGMGHQTLLGNDKDNLATRVSYKLDLKGPSVTVQTGCSTSLVATVLGYQALLSYQCDLVLAGGVSVSVPQEGYLHQPGGIFSPDGHCRAFDARAQGTVLGSGAGVVVLKRLEEALADGDSIYAVIRGAALNNDGALKPGYTAPSVDGQARAILEAHATAGLSARDISYVEAHGTGTSLGDPIEVTALTQAFRASTDARTFCALGSVKTNVGHLDAAAGVTGLIKTTLALQHRELPPSLHFEQPNPAIDFEHSPFFVNTTLRAWPGEDGPRRAGVSSFGLGGTNAHVVLEEAPAVDAPRVPDSARLLVLSAKTPEALEHMTERLAAHLADHPELALADVAHTLRVGREAFAHRRMVVARSRDDAPAALRDSTRRVSQHTEQDARGVVFLFSGQGTQQVDMARGLSDSEPAFRATLDACLDLLRDRQGLDLRPILYPAPDGHAHATALLQRTEYAQPALFVVEYALARLWLDWGVPLQAALGHSLGEYVAATLAGVFCLEDALALVAARGRLMQAMAPGTMLAVPLSEPELTPLLGTGLSLAAVNGPRACVVSGPTPEIEALQRTLAAREISGHVLQTSHAFHSSMMEPALAPFEAQVRAVRLQAPRFPLVSNVTGTWMTADEATSPRYWVEHLRRTVRFADGLETLLRDSASVFLEVGPGRVLGQLARKHPAGTPPRTVLSSLAPEQVTTLDAPAALAVLGQLWLAGVQLGAPEARTTPRPRRIALPTYPFERQRYWIDPVGRASSEPQPWRHLEAAALEQGRAEVAGFDAAARQLDDDALAQASLAFMNQALRHLDLLAPSDAPASREALLARSRILPRYHQLLSRWLEMLVEAGQLRRDEAGRYRDLVPCPEPLLAEHVRRAEARWRRTPQVVELLTHCGAALDTVLRGEHSPLELFASVLEGSDDKPQEELGLHTHYRAILRRGVEGLVKALPATKTLRVLEVGGGTGIATAELLPLLPPERTDYTFTDVAPLFLQQARNKFGAWPFVKFAALDLERPPEPQGLPLGAFDVIVAVNVLHAVRDLPATLERVRSLLAPGGLVLIAELTRPTPDFAITYSLMMNPVEDAPREQGNPFLSASQWRQLLEARGFLHPRSVPETDVLGQHVLIARAPGEAPTVAPAPSERPSVTGLTRKTEVSEWFHVPSWRRAPRPPRPTAASPAARHWLLFLDEAGVGEALAQRLVARGQHVTTVRAGDGLRQEAPQRFTLQARRAEDYDGLLRALEAQGVPLERIVHLWNVSRPEAPAATLATIEQAQALGFTSLVLLAQALGAHALTQPLHLALVSNDAQEVLGETVAPEKALALAACKVLPLEYPNLRCVSVDLALPRERLRGQARPVEHLLEELDADGSDAVVAYRGGHRWVRTLEPVRLEPATQAATARRLKTRGTYLITGGLGKVGLTLADYLATTFQARLVLTRRTPLPAPAQWDAWLGEHPADEPTSRVLSSLRALEAHGAEVLVLHADVADLEAMRAAVAQATERFGPLDGVIHAAGVLGDGGIQHKTPEELRRVLAPKVTGTLVLHTLLKDTPLDFLVLCSSLSAREPGFGQVAYSAANNFLDAFVHGPSAHGPHPVSCIGWEVWRGEGMAYDAHVPRALQKLKEEDFARRGLAPEEGVEVFRRALESGLPHVLVSTSDYLDVLQRGGRDLSQLYLETLQEAPTAVPGHARPALANAYERPEGETEEGLLTLWRELLGIDGIGATDDFFELGGDSLVGTQLLARVQRHFGVKLSTRSLYAHPTPRGLACEIDAALVGDVSEQKLAELVRRLDGGK